MTMNELIQFQRPPKQRNATATAHSKGTILLVGGKQKDTTHSKREFNIKPIKYVQTPTVEIPETDHVLPL